MKNQIHNEPTADFSNFHDEICEDYAVTTQEEIDQILKNCADIYIEDLKDKLLLEKGNNT